MEEIAFAKINLALHVRAREADGYHRIETLFAFAEDGDCLTVEPADALTLDVRGPFASGLGEPGDNLVLRAAEALRARFGVRQGAALTLGKRLPVASGIGGGSADAAAALRLLSRWWGLDADEVSLLEIASSLGADVPACLLSTTARGEGRGDQLAPIGTDLTGTALLLVNPGAPVSTAAVFRAWDGIDRGALGTGPLLALAAASRNDLQAPASALAPEISQVLEQLDGCDGAILVRMSGSGATCFALFETEAARDAAGEAVDSSWWQLRTRVR